MRTVGSSSILSRLERLESRAAAIGPLTLVFGDLLRLPEEYKGERHIVIAKHLPNRGDQQWVEFEEVCGPDPRPPRKPSVSFSGIHIVYVAPNQHALRLADRNPCRRDQVSGKSPERSPVDFPSKLRCLFEPSRYKVLWGGRGGAKSWGIARALLIQGAKRKLRILCAREIQKSISESVLKLLEQQIADLGLQSRYTVNKTSIVGTNGTEFLFCGLKHNIASLKSVEGCDIVWVEEAQGVSKDSWEILIPTIRKKNSEIWISFNPRLDSDETYVRFVVDPPANSSVVFIGWQDNPWFPDVLRIEKDDLLAKDPAAYGNIWEGKTRSAVDGAIYASEIALAETEGRIGEVPPDRTRTVDTYWDLGFGDSTAIWFAQAMPDGTYRIVDYLESSGKTIEWYVIQLNQKGYLYGLDWLPHDGVDMIIHARLGADSTRSIEQLMRNAGRNVRLAPKVHVTTGINSVRTIFSSCWFDRAKCTDGLQAMRHYQWTPDTRGGVESRVPLHDKYSHGADAFRTLAYAIKPPEVEPEEPGPSPPYNEHAWMG